MTLEQAAQFEYNVLDATKTWPHREYPLIEVGKLVLNENPENYFAEIEQLAFAPSTLIPGIAPSPDPILQTRLAIYPDTQVYVCHKVFLLQLVMTNYLSASVSICSSYL